LLSLILVAASLTAAPKESAPVDHKAAGKNAKSVLVSFDKRELSEVIQFVSQFTQRNFILPERVAGKITILSNAPIPADEVWSVFVAALDANNWAVYPVGSYWKLTEKKQSSRAQIPTYLASGEMAPPTEQMVTKLFKLHFVEADQMRNVIAQFTSRDADLQIFPPDTMIISDLGLNLIRLEQLIEQLDRPGTSQEIRVVTVKYAGAQELAQKLTEILQAPKGPAAQATPSKIIADERTNKLVVVGGEKAFGAIEDLLRQLDLPGGDSGVHVYRLANSKAEEIASTLQSLAQGMAKKGRTGAPAAAAGPAAAELFSGDVKVTADKNSNSLVIIASQADYRKMVKVVEQLDVALRQVFIEAVIMEVNIDDAKELGGSLHAGSKRDVSVAGTSGSALGVLGSELGGLSSLGGISSLASLSGFLAGIQGPPITISGVSLPSFGFVLQALQSSSDVNVISTPHIIMADNSEGEISVGQNVPFQAAYSPSSSISSATASSAASLAGISSLYAPIQRQNVELKVHIKAQINQGDSIRLELDEQSEEIASVDKTLGPTTSKRSAKTTVLARDQETVVIGGLIQERMTKSVSKVPLLGSLPILGWLFRSETTRKQKTNLLLFLTPYIIHDQGDVRRIFEKKMAERAEFVRRFYGDDAEERRHVDYDRKPGPLSRIRKGVAEELAKLENGGQGGAGERVIGEAPGRKDDIEMAREVPLAR
jgi:general secretion pathway protein D